MKESHLKVKKLMIIRFVSTLIFLGLLVAFISPNFLVGMKGIIIFLWLVILLLNYFLTIRIKRSEKNDGLNQYQKTNQILFIVVVTVLCFIMLYRGISAGEVYQQIIGYICAVICFVLDILLIWGLKYIKK